VVIDKEVIGKVVSTLLTEDNIHNPVILLYDRYKTQHMETDISVIEYLGLERYIEFAELQDNALFIVCNEIIEEDIIRILDGRRKTK